MSTKKLVLLSAQIIGQRIDGIKKSVEAVRQEIHEVAVQTMLHAEKHGDVTLAQRLADACGVTINGRGLRFWFAAFTPIQFTDRGKGMTPQAKLAPRGGKIRQALVTKHGMEWAVEQANKNPFWTMAEVKEDGNRTIKFGDDNILRSIFINQHKLAESVAVGTFTGDSKKAMELLKAFEKTAVDTYGSKAVEIKKAVEDKYAAEATQAPTNVEQPKVVRKPKAVNNQQEQIAA